MEKEDQEDCNCALQFDQRAGPEAEAEIRDAVLLASQLQVEEALLEGTIDYVSADLDSVLVAHGKDHLAVHLAVHHQVDIRRDLADSD